MWSVLKKKMSLRTITRFLLSRRTCNFHRKLHDNSKCSRESNLDCGQDIHLTSTFNRQTKTISKSLYPKLSADSEFNLNVYCCGPTVYDHSHLGHAISYTRCDLINRTLKYLCNFNIIFAMNITDIDDKIISKSKQLKQDYRSVSNEFYNSFVEDMQALNVMQPDCYLKVTDNIDVIMDYIRNIFDKGFAYVSDKTGDINFDYAKFISEYSITNEGNYGSNLKTEKSLGKRSPKDFALWKRSKPDEPRWNLTLSPSETISGRPGLGFISFCFVFF